MSNFGLLAQIAPPTQLLNMTRKADFASALSNTIVRRGKLELVMSFFIREHFEQVDFSMSKT